MATATTSPTPTPSPASLTGTKSLSATATDAANPNGSLRNIAGVYTETKTVLGLMPHPERLADPALGGCDGALMFRGLVEALS